MNCGERLDFKNRILLFIFVTTLGTLLIISERVTVFGDDNIYYDPIRKYDVVTYKSSLSGGRSFSSDCKSGYMSEEEREGYSGPICSIPISKYDVSLKTAYSVGAIGGPEGNSENTTQGFARRSYASIPRNIFIDPVKAKPSLFPYSYPQGGVEGGANNNSAISSYCVQNPDRCIVATPYEYLAAIYNTKGKGLPTENEEDQRNVGISFASGGVEGRWGVTDYNVNASTTMELICSDELNELFNCGTITVKETSVISGSLDVPASLYSHFNTKKRDMFLSKSDDSSVLRNPYYVHTEEPVSSEGCDLFCRIGKIFGERIASILKILGRKERVLETNRSMAFATKNLEEYQVGFNIPLETVCNRFGWESPQCLQCKTGSCDEFSVEETVSIKPNPDFGLTEKTTDYLRGMMNIFDSKAITFNVLSASNVESYALTAEVGVVGASVRTKREGRLYEVGGKLPERQYEIIYQLGENLNTKEHSYVAIPGFTCEFKGKMTNGWVMRGSDVNCNGELLTILGASDGDALAKGATDPVVVKLGATKVLSYKFLKDIGLDKGISRYKDVGPTLLCYGSNIYTVFVSDKLPYLAISNVRGVSSSVVKLFDRQGSAINTRPLSASFDGDGGLNIVFISGTGDCGKYAGDNKACIYYTYLSKDALSDIGVTNSQKFASSLAEGGNPNTPSIVGNPVMIDEVSYYYSMKPTKEGPVIVYTKGRNENNSVDIYVTRVGGPSGIKLNYKGKEHAGRAEPFVFRVDQLGNRHLLILSKGSDDNYVLIHAEWSNEITVEDRPILMGLRMETIPLVLVNKGDRVTLDDFTFYMSNRDLYPFLSILYTIYPKNDPNYTQIVILNGRFPLDYVSFENPDTPISSSVFDAYVIDSKAIINWVAKDAKMPSLEGRSIYSNNGSIDVALQFGVWGWVVKVEDVTGYSATSRIWSNNYPTFSYTTNGVDSNPIPVKPEGVLFVEGVDFVKNIKEDRNVLSSLTSMSLESRPEMLAPGVELAPKILRGLNYVDVVSGSKLLCWNKLSRYKVLDHGIFKETETPPVQPPQPPEPPTPPTRPPEPPTPPTAGGVCNENWCYTPNIYGDSTVSSPEQRRKLSDILTEKTTWGRNSSGKDCDGDGNIDTEAECRVKYLCDVADRNKISCAFMFAIWYQESSWRIDPNPSGNYLNFGCLLEGYTDSWERQVDCAIEHAVVLRAQEWRQGGGSIQICGESCCTATSEFGYIMEKYTPTDTVPSHGNDNNRTNLKNALLLMENRSILPRGSVVEGGSCGSAGGGGVTNYDLYPVGKGNPIPTASSYSPSNLVSLGLPSCSSNLKIKSDVKDKLGEMLDAARKSGFDIKVRSAYRDYNTQYNLFYNVYIPQEKNNCLTNPASHPCGRNCNDQSCIEREVNKYSARPGESEHQLGTTVDLLIDCSNWPACSDTGKWNECEDAYKWLRDHAHQYGFVISYTPWNGDYKFEPWHARYIGVDLAREIYNKGYLNESSGITVKSFLQERW
jgi:LAS superfamily LD-carboxypeptidase LdcB